MAENESLDINQPKLGINLNARDGELKNNEYKLLVNGNVQSKVGDFVNITNELSNILCTKFKPGYKVIGTVPVIALNKAFFFLVNPTSQQSELGEVSNISYTDAEDRQYSCDACNKPTVEDAPLELQIQVENCDYNTIVNADCLLFNIDKPVRSWVKIDDCNIRIYFTDNTKTGLRYIDYDYQKKEITQCPYTESLDLDCNKIKVFKDTCYPKIEYINTSGGGSLQTGMYQFAISYADALGNVMGHYFYVTNPIPIFGDTISVETNYLVSKSISLRINDLNPDFRYINLVVVKTIDHVASAYLVNTLSVNSAQLNYIYEGVDKNLLENVTLDEIFARFPYYETAENVEQSNGYIFWYNLTQPKVLNLQPVINKLRLKWQTVELNEGDYKNPIISTRYKSGLRDEVYPYAIEFTFINGLKTARFHIPAPDTTEVPGSLDLISESTNKDVFSLSDCEVITELPKWQVYNLAEDLGFSCGYETPTETTVTIEDIIRCQSYAFGGTLSPVEFPPLSEGERCFTDNTGLSQCIDSVLATYPPGAIASFGGSELLTITPETYIDVDCPFEPCNCIPFPTNPPTVADLPDPADPSDPTLIPQYTLPFATNTNCTSAMILPLASGDCFAGGIYNFQILKKYASPSISYTNCDAMLVHVDNAVWYKFTATSSLHAISVAIDPLIVANIEIDIFEGTCASGIFTIVETTCMSTPSLSCSCVADTNANTYLVANTLSPGNTYYVRVFTPNPSIIPDYGTYVALCLSAPTPTEPCPQELVPAVQVLQCTYTISYKRQETVNTNCYASTYREGKFGYWESTELYPCNEEVWGELANTPIRHYKFPDFHTSPFFRNITPDGVINLSEDNAFNIKNKIYPIGVNLDVEEVKSYLDEAVTRGLITEEDKLSICGYRILRGNRIGNQSIVAKGLLYDVWSYKNQLNNKALDILYPNYPYNDLNDDIFLSKQKINSVDITTELERISNRYSVKHPYADKSNDRYTFHSPNTSFNDPGYGTELKLECVQYGYSYGGYTKVRQHAEYQYIGAGLSSAALGFGTIEASFEAIIAASTANAANYNLTVFGTGTSIPLGWILAIVGLNLTAPVLILNKYYEWLELLTRLSKFKNYANYYSSIGRYVDALPIYGEIPGDYLHQSRRRLSNSTYLESGTYNVGYMDNTLQFNNNRRESSVYLNIDYRYRFTKPIVTLPSIGDFSDYSRWAPCVASNTLNGVVIPEDNSQDLYRPIVSYYGSIKNYLPGQYGSINDIEYIDTGYNGVIKWGEEQDTSCETIFGGDTFINRFSIKRKHPFFIQENVGTGFADNSDILYGELFNVAYPRFYFNYPTSGDTNGSNSGSSGLFANVAIKNKTRADYNMACESSNGQALSIVGLAAGIAGSIGAGAVFVPAVGITFGILEGLNYGSVNPKDAPVFINGKIFLYSYGIPSFMCESDYNVDFRYGENTTNKAFYPAVGDIKQWTQETNVPISQDNTFFYNIDYSKQNKENLGYILSADFKKAIEDCKVDNTNRLIYSLQDNDNNSKTDNNLIYLANNYHDFSKYGGKIKLVKGIDNNAVLVIQEDLCSAFNSFVQLQTNLGNTFIGSNEIFSQQPQQYSKTDLGFAGTQHSAFVSTEFGHFWVDAKRGNIIKFKGGFDIVGDKEASNWLKENLPFKIIKQFPNVDIDNPYKHFGISMMWDNRFKRIFITKRDHEVKTEYKSRITYINSEFYLDNDTKVEPTNNIYFSNKCWTLAYSPVMNSIISFYTFYPNYYVPAVNYFNSGVNYIPNDIHTEGMWSHLLMSKSFQVFYGHLHPFMFEYQTQNKFTNNLLDSISYQADFQRFTSNYDYYVKNTVTFNKAFIYNQNQATLPLTLIPKEKNNFFQSTRYPRIGINSKEILVENIENTWRFNNFENLYKNNNQPIISYDTNPMYKDINLLSLSFTPTYIPEKMRNNYFNIRLINDDKSNYMINLKYNINKQTKSFN